MYFNCCNSETTKCISYYTTLYSVYVYLHKLVIIGYIIEYSLHIDYNMYLRKGLFYFGFAMLKIRIIQYFFAN